MSILTAKTTLRALSALILTCILPVLVQAHTGQVCWKVEPNGDVTFYAAVIEHVPFSPVGGLMIDGATYNFTATISPLLLPPDLNCQDRCEGSLPFRILRYQTVTVTGLTSGEHWITSTATGLIDAPWPDCYPTTIDLSTKSAVHIDFKPGGNPNCADPGSKGLVNVAVFGDSDFDVRNINAATLNFAGAAVTRWAYNDVTREGPDPLMFWPPDGIEDLVAKFDTSLMTFPVPGSNCGEVELNGELFDGTLIVGRDWLCLAGEQNCAASTPTMPPQ